MKAELELIIIIQQSIKEINEAILKGAKRSLDI